jgi:hypothetical protein
MLAAVARARAAEAAFVERWDRDNDLEDKGIELVPAPSDHRTPEMVAAVDESIAARDAIAETVATTPAGLAALTGFLREMALETRLFYFEDDQAVAFTASLDQAVCGMSGLRPWAPPAASQEEVRS